MQLYESVCTYFFRELGITDTALARRALQIMGGDVQAAIDLIYSGWNGEGDSVNWILRIILQIILIFLEIAYHTIFENDF